MARSRSRRTLIGRKASLSPTSTVEPVPPPLQRRPNPSDPRAMPRNPSDPPVDDRNAAAALSDDDLSEIEPDDLEPVGADASLPPPSRGPTRTPAPKRRTHPVPADASLPQALAARSVLASPAPVPISAKIALYARMLVAFTAAMVLTFTLIFAPWTFVLSPRLQASRAARLAAQKPPAPQIIEVPVPMPVVVEVPAPAPEPEPVVAARPRPVRRPPPTRPAPVPAPIAAPVPTPVEPEPSVVAVVAEPPVPKAAPTPPPPETPAEAKALEGPLTGTVGGRSAVVRFDFQPAGRLKATIDYGDGEIVKAAGTYAMQGDRATIAAVESGAEGATYAATVDSEGADGRVTLPGGRTKKLKVKR
ncbi:MAG: hypothetical protein R3F61_23935 [Myxococcota bacterium]